MRTYTHENTKINLPYPNPIFRNRIKNEKFFIFGNGLGVDIQVWLLLTQEQPELDTWVMTNNRQALINSYNEVIKDLDLGDPVIESNYIEALTDLYDLIEKKRLQLAIELLSSRTGKNIGTIQNIVGQLMPLGLDFSELLGDTQNITKDLTNPIDTI